MAILTSLTHCLVMELDWALAIREAFSSFIQQAILIQPSNSTYRDFPDFFYVLLSSGRLLLTF